MRAAAACGAICLVDRRCMHNTRDRAALMHQADRHRPLWVAVGKAARAVDGVDDQHERVAEPRRRIGDLFRKPRGVRNDFAQTFFEESVDKEIGLGHR